MIADGLHSDPYLGAPGCRTDGVGAVVASRPDGHADLPHRARRQPTRSPLSAAIGDSLVSPPAARCTRVSNDPDIVPPVTPHLVANTGLRAIHAAIAEPGRYAIERASASAGR